jgi:hypothetical protein
LCSADGLAIGFERPSLAHMLLSFMGIANVGLIPNMRQRLARSSLARGPKPYCFGRQDCRHEYWPRLTAKGESTRPDLHGGLRCDLPVIAQLPVPGLYRGYRKVRLSGHFPKSKWRVTPTEYAGTRWLE